MANEKALGEKLALWRSLTEESSLPAWEALPDFGLYMDQVVTLLEQYLHFLPSGDKEDHIVSSSAINNYVRLKIMPAPVKRKYFRVHLAYLLMILPMKQAISISDIPRILPADTDVTGVQAAYEDFAAQFRKTARFFNEQMGTLARSLPAGVDESSAVSRLALESVLLSSFARILAEQLIPLQERPAPEEDKNKAKDKEKKKEE